MNADLKPGSKARVAKMSVLDKNTREKALVRHMPQKCEEMRIRKRQNIIASRGENMTKRTFLVTRTLANALRIEKSDLVAEPN